MGRVRTDHLSTLPTKSPIDTAALRTKHLFVVVLFFSVFVNILMLTGPLFMLQVYDRVLGSSSEETLVALVALVLALYGLMWLLDFSRSRLLARCGARFQAELDTEVFEHFLNSKSQCNLRSDVDAVQSTIGSPGLIALFDAPFTPIFIALIFIFHPWLGWLAMAGGGVLIALAILSQFLTAKRVEAANKASLASARFEENVRKAAEIARTQGMTDALATRWLGKREAAQAENLAAVDWTGAFSSFTKAFRLTLQSMILALGAWLVLAGEMTAGAMIAGSILMGRALAPIEQLIGRWPQMTRARSAWRTLKQEMSDAKTTERTRLPRPDAHLAVKNLTLATGPNAKPILYDVSFSLSGGEALGIIGSSGSGKTTIAKSILALTEPNVGEVRLGGALMSHYHPNDFGAYVGYLPQEPMLITGTIAENIARMAIAPDSEAVVAAARRAEAHELILSLPNGYDTRVEDNEIGLSGGQKQRIALARALYGDPVLLVLDEPNSALDQAGSEALNAAIRDMKARQGAVVVMTHRPTAIAECDRLLVLDGGRVKAQGPRDEIIRSMMKNANAIQRDLEKGKVA